MPRARSAEYYAKQAARKRLRYANDPAYRARHLGLVAVNRDKRRAEILAIVEAAKSFGCALCPEREPCCMSFHHRDPAAKSFDIYTAAKDRVSTSRLAAELAKCVCVCENCHRKIHAGVARLPGELPLLH